MKVKIGTLSLTIIVLLVVPILTLFATRAQSDEKALNMQDFLSADIDWRSAQGEVVNWIGTPSYDQELVEEQLPFFEKLTGIKVQVHVYPQRELINKSLIDLAGGTSNYDIIMLDLARIPGYAQANFLEPLDQYFLNSEVYDSGWFNLEDIIEGYRNAGKFEEITYGFPYTAETSILMARKDLLEEAGLSVPDTYDELWNAAAKLYRPGRIAGIAFRGQRGELMNIYSWTQIFRSLGGKYFADFPKDLTPTLNTPEAIKGTKFYVDILNKYGPEGVGNWTWEELIAGQVDGTIAMTIDAADIAPLLEDVIRSKTAEKWVYHKALEGPAGRFPGTFSWQLAMNRNSKHKKAAWLMLLFVNSQPAEFQRCLKSGTAPRHSITKSSDFKKVFNYLGRGSWNQATLFNYTHAAIDYRPRFGKWPEVGDVVAMEVQAALTGQKTVEKALDDAQESVTAILMQAGLLK